mgnify:CR=1 FL=1
MHGTGRKNPTKTLQDTVKYMPKQSKVLTTLSDKAKRAIEQIAYDKAQSEETIATKILEAVLSDPIATKQYAGDIVRSQLSYWNTAKNPNKR